MADSQDPAAVYHRQKARADRNESRVKLLAALVAAIGAIATTLGIILGQTAKKVDDVNTQANANSALVKQLQDENADLRSKLDADQKTIDQLRAAAGESPTASPPISSDPPSSDVRREGSFKLLAQKSADLDAPLTDPQWGIVLGGGTVDIQWRPSGNAAFGKPFTGASAVPTQFKLIGSSEPTEDDCRSVTDYTTSEIDLANVKVGTYFCWITSEERFAVLRVAATAKDYGSVTVNAKVFKKSGD